MTNERNRSVPVQVGNISAAVAEILQQEGIVSDDSATNFAIYSRSGARSSEISGLDPISKFEDILRFSREQNVFDNFINKGWGTPQGTYGARELWEAYREALESLTGAQPSVPPDASGALGALGARARSTTESSSSENSESNVDNFDFVDFYLGRSEEESESNLKTALSYETTGENAVDNLNYLAFKSNVFDPGGHNADAFSVWLRGIPSTDLARAYPFVRLSILQSKSSANRENNNSFVPTMSWDFSLNGEASVASKATSWVEESETAQIFRRPSSGTTRETTEQEQFVYKALPDVMNAPQTFRARKEGVLNPMVPQLGLTNFNVRTDPTGYGLITNRSASMSLTLFDRSRMKDIAPLISPTFRGSVAFEIEWGWKCDIAEHMHTPYTRFIDQLRTKEYYSLTSSNFSFSDNGSVNIELRLHLRPIDRMEKLNISVGALAANAPENAQIIDLQNTLRQLAEQLADIISSTTTSSSEDLAVDVTPTNFLGRFSNAEEILNVRDGDPIIQQIKDFIDAYSEDTPGGSSTSAQTGPRENNTNLNRVVELLRSIFGAYTPEERAEIIRSRSAGSGGESSSSAAPNLSVSGRGSLTVGNAEEVVARVPKQFNPSTFGQIVIDAARAEVGVSAPRDTKRSPRVDQYNRFGALGGNWCGAFVSWVLDLVAGHMGGRTIKSSGATRMFLAATSYENITTFTPQDVTSGRKQIKPGDVFVMISPGRDSQENSNRTLDWHRTNIQALREGTGTPVLGHVGFCVGGYNRATNRFPTIEGNTASDGRRDGGRVHERTRELDPNIIVGFFRINALGTERRNTSRTRNSEGQTPSGPNVPSPQVNVSADLRRRLRSVSQDSAIGRLRSAITDAVRERIERLYSLPSEIPEDVQPFINPVPPTPAGTGSRRIYNSTSLDAAFLVFVCLAHDIREKSQAERAIEYFGLRDYASTFLERNDLEGLIETFSSLPRVPDVLVNDNRSNRLLIARGQMPVGQNNLQGDPITFTVRERPEDQFISIQEAGAAARREQQEREARRNSGEATITARSPPPIRSEEDPFDGLSQSARRREPWSVAELVGTSPEQADLLRNLSLFCKNIARRGSRVVGGDSNSTSESNPTVLLNWQKSLDPWMFDFIQAHQKEDGTGVDPFSDSPKNLGGKPFWEGGGDDKVWTSLGRILGFFAGIPLATQASTPEEIFNEVQFFWHAFNSNASWYANQPICNFLIRKDELKSVLEELFTGQGLNISLASFANAINEKIIRNPASASYGFDQFYDPKEDSGPRKLTVDYRENNALLSRDRNALLTRSYKRFGDNASPEWSVPNLAMIYQLKDRLFEGGVSTGNDKIVRVSIRDNAAQRWSGLARILQAARLTDPRLPTQTDLIQKATFNDSQAREIIEYITTQSRSVGGEPTGIDIVFDEGTGIFRVRGGLKRLKELYRKVMPTIVFGGEGTTVTNASFNSVDNSALASIQIMRNISGNGLSPNQANASGLPLRVSPSRIKVEILGFPFLGYSQYFFADFNTGTTVDNIYMATAISNDLSPGKFTTSFESVPPEDAYSRFENPLIALTRAAAIIRERDESAPADNEAAAESAVGSSESES